MNEYLETEYDDEAMENPNLYITLAESYEGYLLAESGSILTMEEGSFLNY